MFAAPGSGRVGRGERRARDSEGEQVIMRSSIRRITLAGGLVAALGLVAGAARADECAVQTSGGPVTGKTLSGEVKQVSGKNVIVTSKGEHIKFDRFEGVAVKGLKTNYDDLKKGDYVVVCSKLLAKPRLAYEITVQEKPKDDAVDVD
jgi:hypothetical protein